MIRLGVLGLKLARPLASDSPDVILASRCRARHFYQP